MENKSAWYSYSTDELIKLEEFCGRYKDFLNKGKTERECVTESVKLAEAKGYKNLTDVIANGTKVQPGDKLYSVCMDKAIMVFYIGKQPLEKGLNILGAHIDSPRLDIKSNPVFEDKGLCYFDTHYYGGIKKYQWVALPLALHGVICKKDGTKITVVIGEDASDPVFCISDLLPHLGGEQMSKPAGSFIDGEMLNIIVGNRPLDAELDENGEKKEVREAVKVNVFKLLKEKYDIEEADFLSAELEAVPSGYAKDMGFDRSLILSYGHDDRVCAFPSLDAVLSLTETPEKTCCALLVDKEEIGSVGATGMRAHYFENAVAELVAATGDFSELKVRRALASSRVLSSDVTAGYDPSFASAFDKNNVGYLGSGVCFCKFTGSRGKSGSNDANAEYIADLRRIMDDNDVKYQFDEMGKVDQGGGGTIAYICALYGMETIDVGVSVLSMHAPFEIISKADIYETFKCYRAFLKNA